MNVTVAEVDPEKLDEPHDGHGQPAANRPRERHRDRPRLRRGVRLLHLPRASVTKACETCNEATEDEDDMLENAPGLKPTSRLSCQAVPNGTCDVVVEVPDWNRNLAKEPHH
jgi:2Fe-2S ferredoxin